MKQSSKNLDFINKDRVLVVIVYTDYKEYCQFLFPDIYDKLTYENKDIAFITPTKYPKLLEQPTGEQVAAYGRQKGIEIARKKKADWIFFLDFDTDPEPDAIQKMLKVKHGLVGGLHCARGNAWQIIGHNYKSRKTLERVWLKQSQMVGSPVVDGISGGHLLVAKGIFNRVDYSGYTGPGVIKGRHTADDEYLLLKIYESLKIRPRVATECKSWHYNDDGRAYRLFGDVKQWRKY